MDQKLVCRLVDDYRGGDVSAQYALWEAVSGPLAAWIHKRFKNLQPADVEAVACEAFAEALLHLSGFQGRAKFSTWLHAIASNIARDRLGEQRPNEGDIAVTNLSERDLFRRTRRVDPRSVDRELLDLLQAAWIVLTADQAMVVVNPLWTKLSRRAVAEILRRSVAAIDMLFLRGMERVRSVARIRQRGLDLISTWDTGAECRG